MRTALALVLAAALASPAQAGFHGIIDDVVDLVRDIELPCEALASDLCRPPLGTDCWDIDEPIVPLVLTPQLIEIIEQLADPVESPTTDLTVAGPIV